jgi:hypothetical protein
LALAVAIVICLLERVAAQADRPKMDQPGEPARHRGTPERHRHRPQGGVLGPDVADSKHAFDIEVRMGAGAYVCGEETALLESLEGRSI